MDNFRALVFDCDGVLLDSNKLKTEAFHKTALPYGDKAARALVSYHINNGGISRNHKFQHFIDEIISSGVTPPDINELLETYAVEANKGLLNCQISPFLNDLREKTFDKKWFIVSGGSQDELRKVFYKRSLSDLFDGGIYGSPATKDQILGHLKMKNLLELPSLFLGDSRYDHKAAKEAGLDFIFVSGWSEFKEWKQYCKSNEITHVNSLYDLTV
jgi:phosphoglycolate phosphatase-like HAD superfamily hydrolase